MAGSVCAGSGHMSQMAREAPPDLHDYLARSPRREGCPRRSDRRPSWRVVDDWPEQVPVNRHEVAVFAAFFGDILDDLFGPV
jgi:hypothetical protein